jgi:hypothetical protein
VGSSGLGAPLDVHSCIMSSAMGGLPMAVPPANHLPAPVSHLAHSTPHPQLAANANGSPSTLDASLLWGAQQHYCPPAVFTPASAAVSAPNPMGDLSASMMLAHHGSSSHNQPPPWHAIAGQAQPMYGVPLPSMATGSMQPPDSVFRPLSSSAGCAAACSPHY